MTSIWEEHDRRAVQALYDQRDREDFARYEKQGGELDFAAWSALFGSGA